MSQAADLIQIRLKHPGLAARAERSPAAAVRLHCLFCQGDSPSDVASCASVRCPLHPFRLGVGRRRTLTDEQRAAKVVLAARARAGIGSAAGKLPADSSLETRFAGPGSLQPGGDPK